MLAFTTRRSRLGLSTSLAVLAGFTLSGTPAGADETDPGAATNAHIRRVFDISREGSKIGTDTFDIVRNGDTVTVRAKTHIQVKIAFITAYRYDHAETGVWKGSQLVSFNATTDDNGKPHVVKASATGNKVALSADGTASAEPRSVQPASLWGAEISREAEIFDPADGKRMNINVEDLGKETLRLHGVPREVQHIRFAGEFARDLWFDQDGLVKMSMLGSDNSKIVSELRTSTASAE